MKQTYPIQEMSLLWVGGESVIMPNQEGILKYVYEDGSQDMGSMVDGRTSHLRVDDEGLKILLEERALLMASKLAVIGATETEEIIMGLVPPPVAH